ncbi:MAG: DUF4386 domain-containing protein [Bacteroidota bacterium]
MKSIKTTGRIVGLLFLLMMLTGAPGTYLRGLSSSLATSENFLNYIFENATQMKTAIVLDLLAGVLGVIISIVLLPILKQYKKSIAYGYFALWVVGFSITVVSNISHLSLLSLSQEFVNTSAQDSPHYKTLGLLQVKDYIWAHFMILSIFSAGGALLYYALFKIRLIPRALSIWFFISVTIVFTVTWVQIFGHGVSFLFYGQNGLHLITLSIWLMVKGFNPNYLEKTE